MFVQLVVAFLLAWASIGWLHTVTLRPARDRIILRSLDAHFQGMIFPGRQCARQCRDVPQSQVLFCLRRIDMQHVVGGIRVGDDTVPDMRCSAAVQSQRMSVNRRTCGLLQPL